MKSYIRYTFLGDPIVCVEDGCGGTWEFAVDPRQMKTPMRIGYTMKRAAEYTERKLSDGHTCPPSSPGPFDSRKRAWLKVDERVSSRHARDLAEAERKGDSWLSNMICYRQRQWKENLAGALAA